MQVVGLPAVVKALVFDIDLTLYDNVEYYNSQTTLLIRRLAEELEITELEMEKKVAAVQWAFAQDNGGREQSLGNTFLHLGISIEQSVRWREELFTPETCLQHDPELVKTMQILSSHFGMSAVTNNPTTIGRRTLRVLGIEDFFQLVIGLDIAGASKPTMVPFEMVAEKLNVPLTTMISIGDRLEIDIELPVKNGMGGIVVEGPEDVYELPDILLGGDFR
jgi:FMN phosphatase YigB (HAD superfamily)